MNKITHHKTEKFIALHGKSFRLDDLQKFLGVGTRATLNALSQYDFTWIRVFDTLEDEKHYNVLNAYIQITIK